MLLSTLVVALTMSMAPAPQAAPIADLQNAYKELKAAEEKKDVDGIKKWAVETSKLAHAIKKGAPDADAEVQKSNMAFAEEVDNYADYALSAAALVSTDYKLVMELRDLLAEQAPDSKYLIGLNSQYLASLEATGNQKKAFPFAEKAIAKDPNNETLLYVLATTYFERQSWANAATYGTRLAQASKRPQVIGRGYYYAGCAYAAQQKFGPADKSLRAALPHIKGEPTLYSEALFQLGIADYQMAHITHDRVMLKDAGDFSEQCSKMGGARAGQCSSNAYTMRKELATFR
jgi:tetratricopeptide (TPR) repeat protein